MDKSRRWNLGYDQHRVGVSSSHRSSIQLRYLAIRRDTSSYVELVEIDDQPRIASRIAPFPSTRGSLERSGGVGEGGGGGGGSRVLCTAKEYSIGFSSPVPSLDLSRFLSASFRRHLHATIPYSINSRCDLAIIDNRDE